MRFINFLKPFLGAVSCLIFLSQPAHTQDFDIVEQFQSTFSAIQEGLDDLMGSKTLKGTRMRLGVAIGTTPDYHGSNNYSFRFLPMITIAYKDKWEMDNGHFHYNSIRKGNFTSGPLVSLNFGREERQNKVLMGLGDVGDTVDLGWFVKYNRRDTGTLFNFKVRHGLSNGQGFRAEFTAGQAFYHKDNLTLLAGGRVKYFARKTMQTNYGITQEQADNSDYGFDAFQAKAGINDAIMALVAVHQYKEQRVRAIGVISYGHKFGSAAKSPISSGTRFNEGYGSRSQWVIGSAITYSF